MYASGRGRGGGRGRGIIPEASGSYKLDNESTASLGRGRGRGRGRGVSNQPAWMSHKRDNAVLRPERLDSAPRSRDSSFKDDADHHDQFDMRPPLPKRQRRDEKGELYPKYSTTKNRDQDDMKRNEVITSFATVSSPGDLLESPLPDEEISSVALEAVADFLDNQDDEDVEAERRRKRRRERLKNLPTTEEDFKVTKQIIATTYKEDREEKFDHESNGAFTDNISESMILPKDGLMTLKKYYSMESEIEEEGKVSSEDEASLDDMFSGQGIDNKSTKRNSNRQAYAQKSNDDVAHNNDDSEGYYRATIGEYLGPMQQYKVLGTIGKGVFSTVIKCIDVSVDSDPPKVVALKLIRNNETMSKAALKELRILKLLATDNGETSFIVELLEGSGFDHANHMVFVFEYMERNLRETLYKFGRNVGIAIGAVHTYSKQLLCALRHLSLHGVVHADIKPDNILVNANYSMLKLCDFGSAFLETDSEKDTPTPYMVSRYYRPPEVILGLEFDKSVDLWSVAVTLAELFTGSVLFTGTSNNDMLKRFMDCLGPFSNKMLRRHFLQYQKLNLTPHFDPVDYKFRQQDYDKVTGRPVIKHLHVTAPAPSKQLVNVLLNAKSASDDKSQVLKFSDFLSRCLVLDPQRRISIDDALQHVFVVPRKKLTNENS